MIPITTTARRADQSPFAVLSSTVDQNSETVFGSSCHILIFFFNRHGRKNSIAIINLRPDGGVLRTPALRFFPDCQKTATHSAAVFGTPYHTCFSYVMKISDPGHARSGHQFKSSDLTS